MKKVLLLIALTTAVAGAMAQGVVNFANRVTSVTPALDSRVSDKASGALLGKEFVAGMYWGTSADSLKPALSGGVAITKAFTTSTSTGLGTGVFSTGSTAAIDGTAAGQQIFLAVVAWETAAGPDYATVFGKGKTGMSNVMQVTLGGGLNPPTVLTDLKAFSVEVVPEPTVLALGVLGGAAFLLRRRS